MDYGLIIPKFMTYSSHKNYKLEIDNLDAYFRYWIKQK